MSGFRPRRGALDTLLELEHHVQEVIGKGRFMVVTFLDLEGAFGSASHNALPFKLSTQGLFRTPLNWVSSFLSAKSFSVAIGNTFSQPYPIHRWGSQSSP